jgi:ceramide glucosyltransferase
MMTSAIETLLLLPVIGGSVLSLAAVVSAMVLLRRGRPADGAEAFWPPVTMLKPVCGLERNIERNLRSACVQDYPDYQVVLSVQRLDDPALPLLYRLQHDYGPERVTVVAVASEPVVNGKVQNLVNAFAAARHDTLVISDSDVFTPPDYLKAIVAPLSDPTVGYVCTLYKGADARTWYEQLELLTCNAEFIPSIIFAYQTNASRFCLGASIALHRDTLEAVGGLEALADYLVEDYEMGRRILEAGQRMVLVPYFVDLTVDLDGPSNWWRHQLYLDQNTRAARPAGFAATILVRAVPFALIYAALRLFDPLGLAVLAGALMVRVGGAAAMTAVIGDEAGRRALWLLPMRDLVGLATWCAALVSRTFVWRGHKFELTRDGRIVPRSA